MAHSFLKFSPLIFITILCLAGVESGYLAIEHYLLRLPDRMEMDEKVEKRENLNKGKPQRQKKDVQIILKRQLFGAPPSAKPTPAASAEAAKNIEPSALDVILMGTINSENGGSRAIILDKTNRKQQLYKVGDAVEGAMINEILKGKVILLSDGRNEVLDISKAAEVRSNYNRSKAPSPRALKKKGLRPKRVGNLPRPPSRSSRKLPNLDRQRKVINRKNIKE